MIGDRWNVTDAEVARRYPCDDLVARPTLQAWRGITVATTPERLWPWVTQVRVAPYSYDLVDNLGRRSPQRLLGLPEPKVGEPFMTAMARRFGPIRAVEPQRAFTGEILGAIMSYVLVPQEESTRLLLKIVTDRVGRVGAPLLAIGDLMMARQQLRNIKRLAETCD
ncbi:polyketide cyclase [Williamsia sp. CHRR-6]|nr:polyketide cyclase [Williamsia sp. CHRR-6]